MTLSKRSIRKKYKFEIENYSQLITYTGIVLEESESHVKIKTIRDEIVILNIEQIRRSTELKVMKE